MHQLALCESLHSASVNIFLRLLQRVCPFHTGWFRGAPAHTALSVQQFLTKNRMTPVPHPPYSPGLVLNGIIFVSLDEKSLQRKTFCQCGRGETKNIRSTWNTSKSTHSKTVLSSGKNILIGVLHQMESILKVTRVLHVRINIQLFINKFWVFGGSLSYTKVVKSILIIREIRFSFFTSILLYL